MKRTPPAPEFVCREGLLTFQQNGRDCCLGYLFHFPGHGVFEPTFGEMEIAEAAAQAHNEMLSRSEIKGLDLNCAVGQGGIFYTREDNGQTVVITWLGAEVSRDVQVGSQNISFRRRGMIFRGRLRKDQDCFSFKRVG